MKQLIQKLVRSFGYEFRRTALTGAAFQPIMPYSNYCPWTQDQAFQEVYSMVKGHTLVDIFRCYELWSLVEQSAKLAEGALMEVGVWRGGTGAILAKQAARLGIKEPVYLCDTFTGVVKAGLNDPVYKGGEHADSSRSVVENLINGQLHLNNIRILEGIFPNQSSQHVTDAKIRLCHIDVDVYQSAEDIVAWVWSRLPIGGILVYDDYGFEGTRGITRHVDDQKSLPDRYLFHNLNGHAVIVKIK